MSERIKQAEDAYFRASKAVRALEDEVSAEKRAATDRIDRQYEQSLFAAKEVAHHAAEALRAARNADEPDHPWSGKKVYRMVNVGRSFAPRMVREDGLVETWRITSERPANWSGWRIPPIGQAVVRPLKKDGTPSARFERLDSCWKLTEGEP